MKISHYAFVAALVLAACLGWWSLTRQTVAEKPAEAAYGVPFTLVAQDGQPITEKAFRSGKPTALFFGFTHCPEVCPTTLYELNGWMEQVDPDAKNMQAYFVTVDPERDTPEVMRTYVSNVSKRIIGVSGTPDKVMDVIKGFKIYAKKVPASENGSSADYNMDHTASILLLDGAGHFAGTISYGEDSNIAVKKLEKLIRNG